MTFALAKMCRIMLTLTLFLWALPAGFVLGAAAGYRALILPAILLLLIYGWVWTRFRPTRFLVRPESLEVIWPLKRRGIPRSSIASLRLVDRQELRRLIGWGVRVGAGGLWGGFGWLWTERRGIVQMYVSRLDGFVWIERGTERPWLVTPDRPDEFVAQLDAGHS